MRESIRLGRIAGIRVGMNWSVLFIVALIWVGLSGARFPIEYPDESTITYVLAGAVAAIVFIVSLLAHELGHALLARRNGVEVEGITLWLLGGVARLKGQPRTPAAELRISGVGPLVSLVLGGFFSLLAFAMAQYGTDGIIIGLLAWLAIMNIALAIFNVIPAAPLDGGRILRALLWMRSGDQTKAAITASRVGKVFGFALMGFALLAFVATPRLDALWFGLIGWFIVTAAGSEERYARVTRALENVRVAQVMNPQPMWVPAGASVSDVLYYVSRSGRSAFPVVDSQGRVTGLLTFNRLTQVNPAESASLPVDLIACPRDQLATAEPGTPLVELLSRPPDCSEGHVVVLNDGRLVGIVSPSDIARTLQHPEFYQASGQTNV